MEALFWIPAIIIAYVYAGYPLLVAGLARLAGRSPRKAGFGQGAWPVISIVVAARNEAARLPERIANLLDTEYPGDREIIVVSDGSTDGTAAALAPFAGAIRLI